MAYFTEDFLGFLEELAANNNKAWFDENRKRYERSVKVPFNEFVQAVIDKVRRFDDRVDITAKEALFRINRDIRFSKDKRPYKSHMAAVISAGGRKNLQIPGLYFHFGAEDLMLAGGMYSPDKDSLHKIRQALVDDHESFAKLLKKKKFADTFGEIHGDKNKRLPAEFKDDAEDIPLLFNKQFFYKANLEDRSVLLQDDLADIMLDYYKAGHEVNQWLAKAALGIGE